MFKCQMCGKTTKAREPMTKIVAEKRDKEYSNGGKGWEIVREIAICQSCNKEK
jgi:hypothetical protein